MPGLIGSYKANTPGAWWRRGCGGNNSLTMTYFHTGCSTIIGAKSFHGPVRDGKGWYQLAMVIRHEGEGGWRAVWRISDPNWNRQKESAANSVLRVAGIVLPCAAPGAVRTGQGYRDKPHGQLVLVSLTHYCASTPSLSTSWSRTTLQGDRSLREVSSQGEFPA